MVEIRHRRPGHICMAGIASGREACRDVTRIIGAGEVGLVAAVAVRRHGCVVVVGVACGAGQRSMSADQREHRGVIEGGRGPDCCRMAQSAVGRKAGRHVGRIGGAVEVRLVASDAGGWQRPVVGGGAGVALHALQGGVETSQRECSGAVIEG